MSVEMLDDMVDLSSLQRKGNSIDWGKSIGCKVKFVYNGIFGEYTLVETVDSKHVKINYNDSIYILTTDAVRNNKMFTILGKKLGNFNCNIGDILELRHQKGEVLDLFRKRTASGQLVKMVKMKCCDCGREWEAQEYSVLKGGSKGVQGCPYCNWQGKFEEGFNDIPTTDPWMIPFFQGGEEEAKHYSHYMTKKVVFKCPNCGKISDHAISVSTLYQTHSIQCSCEDKGGSISENMMAALLTQFNIKFQREVNKSTFPWIEGKRRYDFYLNDFNTIIELHGLQHYENIDSWQDGRTIENRQLSDNEKRETALSNGIDNYIVINCSKVAYGVDKFIDACDESGIFNLLNINKDNIKKDELFQRKSIVDDMNKLIEYLEQNPNARRPDIMKDLNFDKHKYAKYMNSLTSKPDWYKGGYKKGGEL